jgi:hypothetical protein
VILESGLDSSCKETAESAGEHGGAVKNSETKTELLARVPSTEEECAASEERGLI